MLYTHRNPSRVIFPSSCSKVLILSPHPDDVAYSLGGTVRQFSHSFECTILTVFNQSCYAPSYAGLSSTSEVTRVRDDEDLRYARWVNARRVALDFADASVLGHTAESELRASFLDERFEAVCRALDAAGAAHSPDVVFAPLALGGHVDHRIVFEALRRSTSLRAARVFYYEDLPYAWSLSPAALRAQVRERLGEGARPVLCDITRVIAEKKTGISFYRSQDSLTESAPILAHAARAHPRPSSYAERLWRPQRYSL